MNIWYISAEVNLTPNIWRIFNIIKKSINLFISFCWSDFNRNFFFFENKNPPPPPHRQNDNKKKEEKYFQNIFRNLFFIHSIYFIFLFQFVFVVVVVVVFWGGDFFFFLQII